MRAAIREVLPTTVNRLCMWAHNEKAFGQDWFFVEKQGSENPDEFDAKWSSMISEFGLEGNEWLANTYRIRESWIPAYFRGLFLAEILRTTSRSESLNSCLNHFIGYNLALVEFWIRFGTAVEEQRHNEIKADHEVHDPPFIVLANIWLYQYALYLIFHNAFLMWQELCRSL